MNTNPKKMSGCLGALIALVLIGNAHAGITETKHNFSTTGWAMGEICLPCHTPHGGNKAVKADAPLWNHALSTATYTLYTSDTMNAVVGQPDGTSKLCLGCHDGTVALDSFGRYVGTTFKTVRLDRSGSHPISFTYDSALATADGTLWDPATHTTEHGGTIDQDMLHFGKVQCTSCHDVHGRYGNEKLLRIHNAGSALCMTCHNK
ncbi:MAG: cytochrome c3 family protein [Oligoflexia bacterium]|nr:cytochrome c3 family protein [Oligoflexia bacterium]